MTRKNKKCGYYESRKNNDIKKAARNAEYLDMIDRSMEQIKQEKLS